LKLIPCADRANLGVALFQRLLVTLGALLLFAAPAMAHPHILIDAKATVIFDKDGAVSEIRHDWTFDEAYSAWAIQGLDTNNDGQTSQEELQDLANDNMKGLAEYEFYTFAGEGDTNLKFSAAADPHIVYENGHTRLTFGVKPEVPYHIKKALELGVNDPEYYVAITFADAKEVTLENAPDGCSVHINPPEDMPPAIADQLSALPSDVMVLPPTLAKTLRGVQGAIIISCPGANLPAVTAIDAIEQAAPARSAPFGGPPPEKGLDLPRTGIFLVIADLQKSFYAELTATLGRLRTDNTAFWLLGGLSFLYGIIHAAGPGHGKVVIGSYVLANESQFRRGVLLSFASAMVQSLVAVVFVLVAALVLRMTSLAMGDAAWWITVMSYAMVALLGLWLIARKIFGWGHNHQSHDHGPDLAQKAHAHLHEGDDHANHSHDHHAHHEHEHAHAHHVVTPDQIRGGWREQLGVVLAVGMRPCSGALVVLVFALSQGLLAAGIAAVFLMGLGTAITVAILATIAVSAKEAAKRLMGTRSQSGASVLWWLELFGAVAVFGLGVVLVIASF
jgi:nickel/cobalt exporter